MRIRCKDGTTGKQAVISLPDDSPSLAWLDLEMQVRTQLQLPETTAAALEWQFGVPPFAKIVAQPSTPLASIPIRNGDSVLVKSAGISSSPPLIIPPPQSTTPSLAHPRLRKQAIPDDNSCLFHAIAFVLLNKDRSQSLHLRQVIANTIRSNPAEFSAAVLGQPVQEYCAAIVKPSAWGGAIELAIFADYFHTEIVSIDVETCRPYVFGENKGYQQRVFLLYSGIHYDAVAECSATTNLSSDKDRTVFPSNDSQWLPLALELAQQERKAGRFTNTRTFQLQCSVCREALVGQQEAQEHCKRTGHAAFEEFR